MESFMKLFSFALVVMLGLTGCARNMNSNVYTSSSAGGVALEGTVVSSRAITIKDADKLQDNALGGIAGAAVGGIGASNVGKGSGNTAATVGGALAGAAIGALIQDELGTSQGMEYIVKLDKNADSEDSDDISRRETTISRGSKIQDKLKNQVKTKGTSSRLVTVIQGADVVYTPGQRVYVIYNDDRPRITAAY
jgi:outer membrane lipoprotein SlyB